jgi:cytochrome c oxidase assembly factor CtaG
MLKLAARARPWLAVAAVLLVLAVLLPPAGSYARQYMFVQAVQFLIFAVAAPALLVAGAVEGAGRGSGLVGLRAGAGEPSVRAAVAGLLTFIALVIVWRLPVVLNALAAHPVLAVGEMVTLVAAGCRIWLVLAGTPWRQPLACPLRAAVAALAMWTIWAIAYFTGMSATSLTPARGLATARVLSIAADRQLAAGIMWAVPAICFLPVIFTMFITWTGDRGRPGQQAGPATSAGWLPSGPGMAPQAPRGWRSPPAGPPGHRPRAWPGDADHTGLGGPPGSG